MSSQQDPITVPTSTVVAIGAGFVSFAGVVIIALIVIRIIRVALRASRQRRSGESVTFRQLWSSEGGFWGFITGLGGERGFGGLSAGVRSDALAARIWAEMRMMDNWENEAKLAEKRTPIMWEVEVMENGNMGEDHCELGSCQPMALASSIHNEEMNDLTHPDLTMAVLVLLPTQSEAKLARITSNGTNTDLDADEDLPEMVIGTTTLLPFVQSAALSTASTESLAKDVFVEGEMDAKVQLDYADPRRAEDGTRRATWTRGEGGVWAIEGLA